MTRWLRPWGVAGPSLVVSYLSLLVLLPVAALLGRAFAPGPGLFWDAVTQPESLAALRLTLVSAAVVVALNTVAGTAVAWALVRDEFRGKSVIAALVDLPFALPTVVAGLTLLSLYGPTSPLHVNVAFTQVGIVVALAFVTLPFSVRSVQPVLVTLDRESEDAAASLGAGTFTIFRRIILPALSPALLAGSSLAFARAVGEYGSVVMISGNLPFKTELASVRIFGLIQSDALPEAAAVATLLMGTSLLVLLALGALRRRLTPGEGYS